MKIIEDKDFRIVGNNYIRGGEVIINDGVYYLVLEEQIHDTHLSAINLEDGIEHAIGYGEVVEVVGLECQEKRRKGIGGIKKWVKYKRK